MPLRVLLCPHPRLCAVLRADVIVLLLCLQGGSVAHIMRYRYPDGLQEPIIATIMKEVGRQDRLFAAALRWEGPHKARLPECAQQQQAAAGRQQLCRQLWAVTCGGQCCCLVLVPLSRLHTWVRTGLPNSRPLCMHTGAECAGVHPQQRGHPPRRQGWQHLG
jgi:hypothetical protein